MAMSNYSCIISSPPSSSSSSEVDDEIDQGSTHFDGYSLSADVSESESCSSASTFSSRRPPPPPPRTQLASASLSSSSSQLDFSYTPDFPARPTVMFPVVGDRHVSVQPEKEPQLSGESIFLFVLSSHDLRSKFCVCVCVCDTFNFLFFYNFFFFECFRIVDSVFS